jgi:hypothetical protein
MRDSNLQSLWNLQLSTDHHMEANEQPGERTLQNAEGTIPALTQHWEQCADKEKNLVPSKG